MQYLVIIKIQDFACMIRTKVSNVDDISLTTLRVIFTKTLS